MDEQNARTAPEAIALAKLNDLNRQKCATEAMDLNKRKRKDYYDLFLAAKRDGQFMEAEFILSEYYKIDAQNP